jgi:hypothetical protein
MQWDIAAAGLIVGFIIGLTGMGGGALMTPVLVILFGINPSAAISSDVVASFFLKPIGGGVHIRRGTVCWRLVRWLSIGSVPFAFFGAWVIAQLGGDSHAGRIKEILGTILLIAAGAMLAKVIIQAKRGTTPDKPFDPALVRPVPTLLIGAMGGFVVGMTSVGSGSLMIVLLMLMYPTLSSREMVGTDLVQAIPLVGAAALGHVVFGSLALGLTGSVLVGAVPGVFFGAQISSRANDKYIRPVLVAVLTISSLKLLNVSNAVLLGATAAAIVVLTMAYFAAKLRKSTPAVALDAPHDDAEIDAAEVDELSAVINAAPELAGQSGSAGGA